MIAVYRWFAAPLLATMLVAPLAAQEKSFRTADEIKAEFVRLESEITRRQAVLPELRQRAEAANAEAKSMRAAYERALASALANESRIDEQRATGFVSGDEARADVELKTKAMEAAKRASSGEMALRDAAGELASAEGAVLRAMTDKYAIYARFRRALAPVILEEVKITFTDPRDDTTQDLYSAAWSSTEEDRLRADAIEQMVDSVFDTGSTVRLLEGRFREAEQGLLDAQAKWDARNQDYTTQVASIGRVLNALLEAADVGVATAMAGPGWPAVLAYEAVYRTSGVVSNVVVGDWPSTYLPTISDDLIAARQRASEAASGQALGREWMGASDPNGFWSRLGDEEISETVKAIGEIPFAGLNEQIAQKAFPYFLEAARQGEKTSWQKFAYSAPDSPIWRIPVETRPKDVYKALGGTSLEESWRFRQLLDRSTDPKLIDNALEYLERPAFWADAGKGLAAGIAVTAVKEGAKELNRAAARRIFEDMAKLEIEWFMRQQAVRTTGAMLHTHREIQSGLIESLSNAIEEAEQIGRERQLAIALGSGRIAVSDWQWRHNPMLALRFSGPAETSRFDFGAGKHASADPNSGGPHKTEIDRDKHGIADGAQTLSAEAEEFSAYNDGFDADPKTYAKLSPSVDWIGREEGPDRSHRLTFASPKVEILNERPSGFRPGDEVQVGYLAPSNAKADGWVGIGDEGALPNESPAGTDARGLARDSEAIEAASGPEGSEGRVELTAPDKPGRYDLRLYDRGVEGVSVATIPLCVSDPGIDYPSPDCASIVGHWLFKWSNGPNKYPVEIVLAEAPAGVDSGDAGSLYEVYAPTRERAREGKNFGRCVRNGPLLDCEWRVTTQGCAALEDQWNPFQATISEKIDQISANYELIFGVEHNDCSWYRPKSPKILSMEFTRNPEPTPTGR